MHNQTTLKTMRTPGERLKHIRAILRLSRVYIQDKYGLPEVTLKSWENGTTKLTQLGAQRCVEVYRNEGLIVSEDWILDGIGLDPKSTISVSHYFATPTTQEIPYDNDEVAMLRDANSFKESNPNAVIMMVSNDDMRPIYLPGDYVGGKMRYGDQLSQSINKDCIVYLKNGEKYFRRLIRNNIGKYNLTCLNPNETTAEPVLFNVDLECAAPVIWHRKKDE